MQREKCPTCGLVNFAGVASCRRCGAGLEESQWSLVGPDEPGFDTTDPDPARPAAEPRASRELPPVAPSQALIRTALPDGAEPDDSRWRQRQSVLIFVVGLVVIGVVVFALFHRSDGMAPAFDIRKLAFGYLAGDSESLEGIDAANPGPKPDRVAMERVRARAFADARKRGVTTAGNVKLAEPVEGTWRDYKVWRVEAEWYDFVVPANSTSMREVFVAKGTYVVSSGRIIGFQQ